MNISKIAKLGVASLVTGILTGMATADETTWLDDTRADEIRGLIHDVLADADSRASFQGRRANSPVSVNVHGFAQTRWAYNHNATEGVDNTHGFSVPRVRLIVSGDIYDWKYKISGQWGDGSDFELKDAYTDYSGLRIGQFKSPFMKEVLTPQTDTLAIERSVISNQFGQGRSQGIQYSRDIGFATATVAYTDGFNSANGAGVANAYSLTGRVDADVTNWLNFGVAGSYNNLDTISYNTWTVDATATYGDLEFSGAYVATSGDFVGNDWGTVWTGAYNFTDDVQGFVQYENGHLEGVDTDLSIATVGVNYAVNDNIKWTTDFGKSFNGIDAGWDLGDTGWNSTTEDGEYLIRTQLQITF